MWGNVSDTNQSIVFGSNDLEVFYDALSPDEWLWNEQLSSKINWLNALNAFGSIVPSFKCPRFTIDEYCLCVFDMSGVDYQSHDDLNSDIPNLIDCDDDATCDDNSCNSDGLMLELVH